MIYEIDGDFCYFVRNLVYKFVLIYQDCYSCSDDEKEIREEGLIVVEIVQEEGFLFNWSFFVC